MIAIAIVVVAMGLAYPALDHVLDERRFTSAADELVGRLMMARASAQAQGNPVEVMCDSKGGSLVVKPLHVRLDNEEQDVTDPSEVLDDIRLPAGMRLVAENSEDVDDSDHSASQIAPDSASENGDSSTWTRIIIYAADGSAIQSKSLSLIDESGRRGRLVFNPLTGMLTVDSARTDTEERRSDASTAADEETDQPATDNSDAEPDVSGGDDSEAVDEETEPPPDDSIPEDEFE